MAPCIVHAAGWDARGTRTTCPPALCTGCTAVRRIAAEEGAGALFSGLVPRVCWMFIGGFVFFGAYEQAKSWLVARQEEEQEQ